MCLGHVVGSRFPFGILWCQCSQPQFEVWSTLVSHVFVTLTTEWTVGWYFNIVECEGDQGGSMIKKVLRSKLGPIPMPLFRCLTPTENKRGLTIVVGSLEPTIHKFETGCKHDWIGSTNPVGTCHF